MKIVFCTPTITRPFEPYLAALEGSIPALDAAGIEHSAVFRVGDVYISHSRSYMLWQAMKTGALIHAAVMLGAELAGAEGERADALSRYGLAAGAAFQIADDILDVEASAEAMGKATGKDAGAGKGTLVGLMGLAAAKTERDRLVNQAVVALAGFGPEADLLRQAAQFIGQRAV